MYLDIKNHQGCDWDDAGGHEASTVDIEPGEDRNIYLTLSTTTSEIDDSARGERLCPKIIFGGFISSLLREINRSYEVA